MKPCLDVAPCLEMGSLRASANFQEPDVRVVVDDDGVPSVRIEEGGVTVVLEFPDLDCLTRFTRRLARTPVPGRSHR